MAPPNVSDIQIVVGHPWRHPARNRLPCGREPVATGIVAGSALLPPCRLRQKTSLPSHDYSRRGTPLSFKCRWKALPRRRHPQRPAVFLPLSQSSLVALSEKAIASPPGVVAQVQARSRVPCALTFAARTFLLPSGSYLRAAGGHMGGPRHDLPDHDILKR